MMHACIMWDCQEQYTWTIYNHSIDLSEHRCEYIYIMIDWFRITILNYIVIWICIGNPPLSTCKNQKSKPSKWCSSDKSLGPRGLLPLWSQVRAMWLLIWWPLEVYMVVNFRARGISRGTRKLTRTPTLN
jgi:hypothetical protein